MKQNMPVSPLTLTELLWQKDEETALKDAGKQLQQTILQTIISK